jgi:ABC-type antimicrobial peptide transport system permease subunit
MADSELAEKVYGFNMTGATLGGADAGMLSLILIGAVVLLLPIFTFITSASRIAGAERDRRLSALRLVGAGKWQVRRIAAAESLVSAVVGLAAGGAIFAVGRLFADDIQFFGEGVYTSDVVPNPVLAVLLVVLVPALSVLTALFALRRTIIEPLGVVRQSKPVRRRAWWRFALVVLGVVLMTTQLGAAENTDTWSLMVTAGATLLMVGMLVLLPWLVERVANRVRGGPPSWMLAIRRLQLDSGTSARVVGGVAVVLAGMIALQTMLLSIDDALAMPGQATSFDRGVLEVTSAPALADDIQQKLLNTEGVLSAPTVVAGAVYEAGKKDNAYTVAVLDCAALKELGGVKNCADGDVFASSASYQKPPPPGTALEFRDYLGTGRDWDPTKYTVAGNWTVPKDVKNIKLPENSRLFGTLYATPGALSGGLVDGTSTVVAAIARNVTADQLEGIRNAVADYRWQTYFVYSYNTAPELTADQQMYASVRLALYGGSIFTLMLAGVSVLVLALEHIRERRRPLAILAATGVPKSVLRRSLLWQVALPIGLGVIMALITGIGLAALMIRLIEDGSLKVDWSGVTLLCTGAMALSLLVSAMTLPFLNRATRLTTIRTE